MLPILASVEKELTIREEDAKMLIWFAPPKGSVPPLVLLTITPGMERKPTLTASITVD
jgi:hypothetical protein